MKTYPSICSFLLAALIAGCSDKPSAENLSIKGETLKIAFGSCNMQGLEQPLWPEIIKDTPDIWLWLGDTIYGDTEDMSVMRSKYDQNKNHPKYFAIRSTAKVHGTWDDHDYGVNDGGKEYPKKKESKEEFVRFFDYSDNHPIHDHEGVYHTTDYVIEDGFRLRIIMLDTRYFRDELRRPEKEINGVRYVPSEKGTMLGEAQWVWLDSQLDGEDFDFCVIGSSIQLIAEEHGFEKWANLPHERNRILNLLDQKCPGKVIIISGDRHHSEISKVKQDSGTFLYDVTSSGLNRPGGLIGELNVHRIGPFIGKINYGLLDIDTQNKTIHVRIKGVEGVLYNETELSF